MTSSFFLPKIAQIVQKVIVFFLERREKIEPRFWHIWIAKWLKFFHNSIYSFRFQPSSRGNGGSKLDQKCKLWVLLFSIKRSSSIKFFKVFVDEHLSWTDHINILENKLSKNLGLLHKSKHFLNAKGMKSLYFSFFS